MDDVRSNLPQMNTVCPVCGQLVPEDFPAIGPVPTYQQHQQPSGGAGHGFRVCSVRCAEITLQDPERFAAAAANYQVAGTEH